MFVFESKDIDDVTHTDWFSCHGVAFRQGNFLALFQASLHPNSDRSDPFRTPFRGAEKLSEYPSVCCPNCSGTLSGYSRAAVRISSVHCPISPGIRKNYERISLHPDNLRFESIQPARIQSGQIYEVAYRELIEELRHNLSAKVDEPVPVFPFGYDWRQPIDLIEQDLELFIDEVINRTKLLRHYDKTGYSDAPKVNLVAHSMGGLVVAGCIERMAKNGNIKNKIGRVVTLASPFRGSFEAIVKIATGTANIGGDVPSSRERESARITPALYHLFPSMGKASIQIDPGLSGSTLFDPSLVQESVLKTLAEFIRLNGLNRTDQSSQAQSLLSSMLSQARQHRDRIEGLKLADVGMNSEDWLCIVGVDSTTRVRLKITNDGGKPIYDLSSKDRVNHWTYALPTDPIDPVTEDQRRLTGDGTVPFDGAVPGFLSIENLVCVSPKDFGYWELQDRATASLAGFHGILPNMNMLHRMIKTHLQKQRSDPNRTKYENIWGRPAPGVTASTWQPPIKGLPIKD